MFVRTIVALCLSLWMIAALGCQTAFVEEQTKPTAQPDTVEESAREINTTAYFYYSSAQVELKAGQIDKASEYLQKAIEMDPDSSFLKLELAELWVFAQKFDQAIALLEEVLKKEPEHVLALTMLGRIYQHLDNLPEAKQAYEKALAAKTTDQSVYLSLGRFYWDEQDLDNAARVFNLMADQFSDSYAAHYFVGKVLVAQGKLPEAIAAFERSLMLDPTLEEPRLELIDIYKAQKRSQDVISAYQALLTVDPRNPTAALGLAVYYYDIGQPQSGRTILIELGRRVHEEPDLLGVIYDSYLDARQYKTAVWILNGMLEGDPRGSDLHYLVGLAYDGLSKPRDASRHLAQVTPDSRFYGNAVVHGALLLRDAGRMDLAIAKIEEALRHEPANADFYFYLGTFHEELERFEEALALLRKGLALDGENARLYFRLGVVLDKLGRRHETIEAMRTVIRLTPDDADALNYLGYTYADMGIELEEAEKMIRAALELKPDDGYFIDSLGWVYFKRGDYESALRWLQKALTFVDDDPVIFEHLGDVYEKLGQKQKARYHYSRALEAGSKNHDAIQLKIQLLGGK